MHQSTVKTLTIEKIIYCINEEAHQERLADLILSDFGLQEELNLNTPDNSQYDENLGFNYLTVAKVGIMVFADYIHDTRNLPSFFHQNDFDSKIRES